MKHTLSDYMLRIYYRLCIYTQMTKDVLFILKKRSNTPVQMVPFDKKLERQANAIVSKIKHTVPQLTVKLLGSVNLKIYGKRDIDIYIECPVEQKDQATTALTQLLGMPTQTGAIVGWSYKEQMAEVEIILINPQSLYYQAHLLLAKLLISNPAYRSRYVELKKKHNNMPRKIYSRNKTLFLNSILLHHVDELVSALVNVHKYKQLNQTTQSTAPRHLHGAHTKPSVMIGITAYNEEKNIKRILSQIVTQKMDNYSLFKIVVVSDASTDETDSIISTFPNDKITLIRNSKNIGKTKSVLLLHKEAKRLGVDITILIDADVYIPDKTTLSSLVQPIISDDTTMTVSGNTLPLPPRGYIENIAHFADALSRDTYSRSKKNINYYQCTDQLIALRSADYATFDLTNRTFLHDGAYYLLTVMANKKFVVADNAIAYYQLPTILREYVSQMNRFSLTDQQIMKEFSSIDISSFLHITIYHKLLSFFRLSIHQPIVAIGCICIHAYIYIRKVLGIPFSTYHAAWNTQQSTRFPRSIDRLPIVGRIRNQTTNNTFTLVVRQEACGIKYVEKTYKGLFFMSTYRYLAHESMLTCKIRSAAPKNTMVTVPNMLYTRQRLGSFTSYYEYVDGVGVDSLPTTKQIDIYTTVRQWATRHTTSPLLIPKKHTSYFCKRIVPIWIASMFLYPNHARTWIHLLFIFIQGIPTLSKLQRSIIHGDLSPDNMIKTDKKIYLLDISILSISYNEVEPLRVLTNNVSPIPYKNFVGKTIVWNKNTRALAAYYFLADTVFNHDKARNIPKIDVLIQTYLYSHEK